MIKTYFSKFPEKMVSCEWVDAMLNGYWNMFSPCGSIIYDNDFVTFKC